MLTTQKQIRAQFWLDHPSLDHLARLKGVRSKPQNNHSTDTRLAFVDYVDMLRRDGQISEALANRVTL